MAEAMGLKKQVEGMIRGEISPPGIIKGAGLRITKFGEGEASVAMDVDERYHNSQGVLHGGIYTLLADTAMGLAAISTLDDEESFTTVELKINFIRPVTKGTLLAEGKVVHRGTRTTVIEATVLNTEGKLVAVATSTGLIVRDESAPAT